MVGFFIVTAGALSNTIDGDIIAVLSQYSYTCRVTSIHSSGKTESYKSIVDKRSMKNGGKQGIITQEGYIIPIEIYNSITYIIMQPYTDQEFSDLLHIILTKKLDWDPHTLNCSVKYLEEWYDDFSNLLV